METFRAASDTIACTLTPSELRETSTAWRKLLRLSLITREEVPGGVRLIMHPGSAGALRQLVDIERECCRWITFELEGAGVTMTAAGAGAFVIRQMLK